jgi:hypothetical protein
VSAPNSQPTSRSHSVKAIFKNVRRVRVGVLPPSSPFVLSLYPATISLSV